MPRRNPTPWSAALLLLGLAHLGLALPAAESPVDLTGVVTSANGRPLTNASVFIYTAGPRVGVGSLCPSCYADCRKSARSGADGAFRIEEVSPSLLFRVLVVAPGHEPTFFPETDPRAGPLAAVLKPRSMVHPPERTLLGRVLDPRGRPVPQAVVSVETTQIGDTYHGYPPAGTDPLAVADDQGNFQLGSPVAFESMHLRIEARARARGLFAEVRPGRARRDFVLTEGVSIVGRLRQDGRPVANVVVGACGTDRSIGKFTGDFVVATQENGQFALTYLPADREYFVYGQMESLARLGTMPLKRVRPGRDGATLDLGDVAIGPGRRLAGQVRLSDDQPLPEATRLLIGRENAWDTRTALLPPDGRFDVANLPPGETLSLSARVQGYRPSPRNASFEALNGLGLAGRLDTDKTNLVFLLEPGEPQPGSFEPMPEAERPQNRPLGGLEVPRTRPAGRRLQGQVADAETGQPLPVFRVTPGQSWQAEVNHVEWYETRAVDGTQGRFALEVPKEIRFVVLQAEAEGYLPERSPALAPSQRTWRFALRRGHGPSGTVRDPDGRPSAGVRVLHLGPGEQAYLPAQGELVGNLVRDGQVRTDDEGRFQLSPKVGPSELIAAADAGFVRVRLSAPGESQDLRLQPWGRVTGRLLRAGQPLGDEAVELHFEGDFQTGSPLLNLQGTRTDDQGRFVLERVPAGSLTLGTRRTEGDGPAGGWTVVPQRRFVTRPGATVDLGDIEKK